MSCLIAFLRVFRQTSSVGLQPNLATRIKQVALIYKPTNENNDIFAPPPPWATTEAPNPTLKEGLAFSTVKVRTLELSTEASQFVIVGFISNLRSDHRSYLPPKR